MIPSPAPTFPQSTHALDCLFSRLAGNDEPLAVPADASDAGDFAEVQSPPKIETAEDVRAAHEWLLRERRRLDQYTRSQLARIQQEHQAFVRQTYLKEQTLVFRTQELNRKEEMISHQDGVLRRQADALAERERKLAPYLDPLWKGQEELAELRRVSTGLRQDTQGQQAFLDKLRREAASLQQWRAASEVECAARAAQMNQRLLDLERAEAAVGRRQAELTELETRLSSAPDDRLAAADVRV